MFKVKNGLVQSYIKEILDSAPNSYNLRNNHFISHISIHYAILPLLFLATPSKN